MNIIVFGASGGTGREVVKLALEEGHRVTAFVRTPSKLTIQHPLLQRVEGNGLDRERVIEAIKGHDAVISALGTDGLKKTTALSEITSHILAGMKEHDVSRIAYTASAGIDNEIPGFTGFMATKILKNVLADHKRAVDLLKESGTEWTIARPLRLEDGTRTGGYRMEASGVPQGGKSISRSDVAHFLLNSVTKQDYIFRSVGLAY
ncbi:MULTISPECIES: NAD(P)-dependent oxidoreductase [Pontibacillus]|uniref:SDR family oxidoreductase n=1 Tax=Pontibacillus chungwhensis TaxID=265426 RepID=A0ABY8UX28_9BACI|nr:MULTISPECIES: NAD(P)-binding oxidoreductase [Pontibacillus]MCD5325718.1 SDR family oxidoreductase [Pontibacillus sp. HN14]WIF98044.1 SDR family oxidoreductase [Pontibacillus chungwhensis]